MNDQTWWRTELRLGDRPFASETIFVRRGSRVHVPWSPPHLRLHHRDVQRRSASRRASADQATSVAKDVANATHQSSSRGPSRTPQHTADQAGLGIDPMRTIQVWTSPVLATDPRRGRVISAAPGIHPFAGHGGAVVAERASIEGWRALLATPDGQSVAVEFVYVVEGVTGVVVVARLDVLARLCSKWPFVADDLDALGVLPVLLEVNVLEKKEATVHPLVGDLSLGASRDVPGADQSVQGPEIGIRLRGLLEGVGVVNCHRCFSSCYVSLVIALIRRQGTRSASARAFSGP